MNRNNGTPKKRLTIPKAPSSDGDLFLARAPKTKRRHAHPIANSSRNKSMYYHGFVATVMAAFVLFQIYFLQQLEKYHDNDNDSSEHIPWIQEVRRTVQRQQRPGALKKEKSNAPPKPTELPPPKTTLLPKHVVTIFGPESSGTTFLSTTLGIAVGAWAPEGKWTYIQGNQWTIPGDTHEFTEPTRWLLETSLGRRAMSPDGMWEIQHLSLPWGWFCEEDRQIEIVEALVPEECWRYEEDSHVSPKAAEAIWYGAKKRKRKRLEYYKNPDNFVGVEKIPRRRPQEKKYIELCKNEVHITQGNDDEGEWTCGAKCGTGVYDGFALYPKRFSVNITSHIEWYLSRGIEVTAILSARDRTISTKSKLQDHCKLNIGVEEDNVALGLMTEALERYGKSASDGDRERALVVSYEGLMGMGKSHLFDLYKKLGINSTYVPVFADGNNKYVVPYTKKKPKRAVNASEKNILKAIFSSANKDSSDEDGDHEGGNSEDESEPSAPKKQSISGPPAKPSNYNPPLPKENLLPKRVIAVFGPESSGTTFLTSVLGVATGAFPEEGKWTQVLAPDPQESVDPTNPRMKWKFEAMIPARATTPDGEIEVQHLSLPSGWVCQKQPEFNDINIVEALIPAECMRYETLPNINDLRLAEQIWYNQHAEKPKNPNPMTDTVEGFNWEVEQERRKNFEDIYIEKCRNEVNISEHGSCGAKCGRDEYDGFALYPNRYFVNITSHIEWYLSRDVDITVVISMRDRSISRAAKHREHCRFVKVASREDDVALSLIRSAIEKYGIRGSGDEERVVTVSYEAMMEFQETYLFDLYHQLKIESNYVPEFKDGNWKYVTNATKGQLAGNRRERRPRLTPGAMTNSASKTKTPPADWKPKPAMKNLLPKRVITVVGPESSGTTLLATSLGVATGAFDPEGEWHQIDTFGKMTKSAVDPSEIIFERDVVKKMDYKETVSRRAHSLDGIEVQHLSLPWGWICEDTTSMGIVEALVPEECFRYERAPNMDPHFAEGYFWSEHSKKVKREKLARRHQSKSHRLLSEETYFNDEDVVKLKRCREEAMISEGYTEYSCGAECGRGAYDGFALYPQRFSVNISSHIQWYLSRGVDVTVVMSIRDSTITHIGKQSSHCKSNRTADMENDVALSLMQEALEKYGRHGSMLEPGEKERVISMSYETLMNLQEPYLLNLYSRLGIDSAYVPEFKNGNFKYVTDLSNRLDPKYAQFDKQANKPVIFPSPARHDFFLPRRLISVFSIDSSMFLSTSIAVATGTFPEGGRWVEKNSELVYEDTIQKSTRSADGEVEVQHIMLPASGTECESVSASIIEALVPSECSLEQQDENQVTPDPLNAQQCKDEVHILEENDSAGATWTCGALCGTGENDGFALYPQRYFVNISSHIEWYTSRGVHVTAVLQIRDGSITKNTLKCQGSRMLAAREKKIGLELMKDAYTKYVVEEKGGRGTHHVIAVSYETLMLFKERYLLEIYEQLGINSPYVRKMRNGSTEYPLSFTDENTKYIRAPPSQNKKGRKPERPHRSSRRSDRGGGLFERIANEHRRENTINEDLEDAILAQNSRVQAHKKTSEEYEIV